MGEQKEEDLYRNFSRKDLQGLCKKYGLPAKKSNSEMATSLILYLEQKNLSSRSIWEGSRSDLFALGTKELQSGVRMNLTDDQRRDCGRTACHSGSSSNPHHNHRDAQQNDMQKCTGLATSDKVSEDVEVLTQLQRESNSGAGIPENTFSSVLSSTAVTPSPTFTFDVCCEDGIQLSVDLDSTPSDWIESLKAGVHICDDLHKTKSQSFHEDIGLLSSKEKPGSVAMDPCHETEKGQLEQGSFPTTSLTDEADKAERFLSPPLNPGSNAGHSLENSKEVQASLSSRLEFGTQRQLPDARCSRLEEALVTDLDVNAAAVCNLTGISMPSDPKSSGMPTHQGAIDGNEVEKKSPLPQVLDSVLKCGELPTVDCMEMQASSGPNMNQDIEHFSSGVGKCVDLSAQLKDPEVVQHTMVKAVKTIPSTNVLLPWPAQAIDQSKCMPLSPVWNSFSLGLADTRSKVDSKQTKVSFSGKSDKQIRQAQMHSAENAEFVTTHEAVRETDAMQKKYAALDPSCSDCSLDFVVPRQNGVDHHICRSPSASKGTNNTGNDREGSEFSNFDNQMEKPSKELVDSESNRELKRKKSLNSVEGQNKFADTEAKNLRSPKQFSRDAHSRRRRSSRLFTK